jgi:SLT domain-containing protein
MIKESHWKDHKNPNSSASGVGQLLDSTYQNLGMKRSKTTIAQTVAALAYIGRHYGSGGPCSAWQFFKSNGYY